MGDELVERFFPIVVGARVGDAMGSPTEGLSSGEIANRFGWVTEFAGDGTDDSLMATLLAEALVATDGHAGADDWGVQWIAHRDQMLEIEEKFFVSVLHTAEKLALGFPPRRVAKGNMPSSSSAMCIWPIGLVNAGVSRAAAAQAYAVAALIHVDDVDFCQDAAAAIAAAVAAGLRPGMTMAAVCSEALAAIHPVSGGPMHDLISDAVALANRSSGYEDFRQRYQARFQQSIACDSRETVPAAFGLAVLAGGRLRQGVEYAANFGRDTDTLATMTGALCGAISGPDEVPEEWIAAMSSDAVDSARMLAARLARVARAKAAEWIGFVRTVPGLDVLSVSPSQLG